MRLVIAEESEACSLVNYPRGTEGHNTAYLIRYWKRKRERMSEKVSEREQERWQWSLERNYFNKKTSTQSSDGLIRKNQFKPISDDIIWENIAQDFISFCMASTLLFIYFFFFWGGTSGPLCALKQASLLSERCDLIWWNRLRFC